MRGTVSFEGIGEVMATFYAQDGVERGQVVKVNGESSVSVCAAGERFDGVAVSARDGFAGVQVGGFAELPCEDSTVAVGRVSLTADGKGGVKKAGAGDTGHEYLVVSVDGGCIAALL